MGTVIVIPGLSSATKRPGFYGQIVNPAGRITASSIPFVVLLAGNKRSAGAMTADGTPIQVNSVDEVDYYAGSGSELACMAYGIGGTGAAGGIVGGALAIPGVQLWLGAITEASGGPAPATCTITIAGSWSTGGTIYYRLSGITIPVNVAYNNSATDVAVSLVAAINSNARLPFTAGNIAGVVTVTTRNSGLRNNWHCVFQDTAVAPAGLTSTLAGGTSMTGGGKRFTGGAGSDSPTTFLATIVATQYDRIAVACGDNTLDTTNIALWKTQINAQAAPTSGILQQVIIASTDTLTNAASIAQTTLNDIRFSVLNGQEVETHPSVIAATFASKRAVKETQDPNAYYDALIETESLPGVAPQKFAAVRYTGPQQETALGEGVTPLTTYSDGTVRVVRAITTHCLNGSTPDYRVLDTNGTTVPDFVLKALELEWTSVFLPANPRVQDNPASELPVPPEGVAYPNLWNAVVQVILNNYAQGKGGLPTSLPILDANEQLANPPVSTWNSVGKFITSAVPVIPANNQHIIGVSVRNVTSA